MKNERRFEVLPNGRQLSWRVKHVPGGSPGQILFSMPADYELDGRPITPGQALQARLIGRNTLDE